MSLWRPPPSTLRLPRVTLAVSVESGAVDSPNWPQNSCACSALSNGLLHDTSISWPNTPLGAICAIDGPS